MKSRRCNLFETFMMWVLGAIITASLVLSFSGCGRFGIPKAKTPREKMAYAYGSLTAVMNTTQMLLSEHVIPLKVAKQIYQQGEVTKALLDKATELEKMGQPIDKTLAVVEGIVSTLQMELNYYKAFRSKKAAGGDVK